MAVFIAMTRFTALLLKLSVFPISRHSHFFDAKEHMYNLRISGRACCALSAGQIYYKDMSNMIPKFNHSIFNNYSTRARWISNDR